MKTDTKIGVAVTLILIVIVGYLLGSEIFRRDRITCTACGGLGWTKVKK